MHYKTTHHLFEIIFCNFKLKDVTGVRITKTLKKRAQDQNY